MSSRSSLNLLPTSNPIEKDGTQQKSYSSYTPLLVPLVLFPLTTALVISSLTTVPLPSPLPTEPTPKSLSQIVSSLSVCATPSPSAPSLLPALHLLLVFSLVTIWKHAWSIPGAVLLNVIAGGIWGGLTGTFIMTWLTALGSVAATLISRSLSHWMESWMPRAIQITKSALDANTSTDRKQPEAHAPWVRLALLRLIGLVPWSGINIASGVVRVPLLDCLLGAFIGCAPWTAVTCQVGDILNDLGAATGTDTSVLEIFKSPEVIVKLVLLSMLGLLPLLARQAMKSIQRSSTESNRLRKSRSWLTRFPLRSRLLSLARYDEESLPLASLSVKDS